MCSRETFLAVPDTNVSHPDLPGLAASLLQSTPRRVVVNCCVLFFRPDWASWHYFEFTAMRLRID